MDFTRVLPEGFTVTLPAARTRSGYIFLGWCGSGATYGAGDVVTVVGDVDFVPGADQRYFPGGFNLSKDRN